nr:MAK10-like protein [Tanacetum cinerariifolium]
MDSPPYFAPPHHHDSSRPTIGFPLGTALLLIVVFSLSGIFSCCYHWDKLRHLRGDFSDDDNHGSDDSDSKLKPVYSALFYDPLIYNDSDVDVVENVDLDVGKHLKALRNDNELANFVQLAFENGCNIELYVEHDVIAEGVTSSEEVVNDEIEMKDIYEYVGFEQVVEEDVVLIDLKLGRCSNKKGKQKVDENICTPNFKSMSKAKQSKSPKSKSNSPKTPQLPKTPKSSKTPKVTPNIDTSQKVCSFRRSVKHHRLSYRLMKADVRDKYLINARGAWLTGSSKRSEILSGSERTARLIFKTLAPSYCTRSYTEDLLQKVHHHDIDLWLQIQIFYDHVNPATRQTIDQSAGGKLHDKNAKESWALLEDLDLYENESWNDPRDFAEPVKAISLPQDVSSISDRRLIELENQVQRLMEAHFAPYSSVQVNKITSSCEIGSGPHETQYCMENPEQA